MLEIDEAMTSNLRIGFAWYTRRDWEHLRDKSVDPEELDASFDEWEFSAIETECQFQAMGREVHRIAVTAEGLVAWCKANRRPLDRAARAAYVSHLMELHALGGKV